ncbi:MAG: MFS transporter [Gemmataceae bacterium]|nr:MFS transporter [Gemmataceae bacterium]
MRWRLSLLMLLQYAPAGGVIPFFTLRMEHDLAFTPMEMGWACATQAMAGLVGPVFVGQAADRWFPAEHCLSVLAGLAGVVLWFLATITQPLPFFLASLAFWLLMGPALTLGTSISFAHLSSGERDFGPVRMWGTIGWATTGLLLGVWFSDPTWLEPMAAWIRPGGPRHELADAFRLAGVLAFVLSLYALTLPHTPPQRHAKARLAPLAALHLLRSRSFAVYCACTLGMCATLPFPAQVTPLLLKHLGVPLRWLGPTLTIGQSMEVVSLALLPVLLLRLGVRGTMLLGLGAWLIAMSVLTIGGPLGLIIATMPLNGLCVCGYFVAGQVFVNSRAHGEIRASAQALLTFVNGMGLLIGNLLVGGVRELANEAFAPTFAVAAGIAGTLTVLFFVGFKEEGEGLQAVEEPSPGSPELVGRELSSGS